MFSVIVRVQGVPPQETHGYLNRQVLCRDIGNASKMLMKLLFLICDFIPEKDFPKKETKDFILATSFLRSDNLRHRQGQSCYDHQHLLMLGRSSLCGSNFLNKFGNEAFLNNWELFYDCVKTRTVCCIAKIFFWCSLFC